MFFLNNLKRLFKRETDEDQNFLSLAITPNEILAAVWCFSGEQVEIVGFAQKLFKNLDGLIHQAAVAIDNAGKNAQSDVSQAVFGLSHFWLEDGQLNNETSRVLKELSEDLELEPQAFIPIASAISHLLKVEEAITPQAVLVGIFDNYCEAHLLEGNRITSTKTAKAQADPQRIVSLIESLKEEGRDLPSRMIIYPQHEEKIIELLKNHKWDGLFAQPPKINVLDGSKLTSAVAYAQAADLLGHEPALVGAKITKLEPAKLPSKSEAESAEFGFVEGEDILLEREKKTEPPPKEPHPKEEEFTQNLKITAQSQPPPKLKIKNPFAKIFSFSKFQGSPKKLGIALVALFLIIILGVFIAGQTLVQAEVAVKVNAQEVEKAFRVNVVARSNPNLESEIAGEETRTTSFGSQKAVATGVKKIGDKAKGEVVVRNFDVEAKTFKGGTEIITEDGSKFTLDADVEAPPRSGSQAGEAKAAATSVDVGDKFNIASGVKLTIVGFDELFYEAESTNSFTGGSERESTVVSREDLDRLEKSLTDSQVEKAKSALREKAGGKKVHDEAITIKIIKAEFDKKVDEEASLVNLDMEVEASTIVYEESALKSFLAKLTQEEVSPNQEARPQDLEIVDITVRTQKGSLLLSGKFQADLVPKFNEDELRDKIAGKSEKEAR
ncbi:hypothetical protein HYS90_01695, partial [Candidatus Curtissbacteria bacterium]|nr:hypothetical protein [Candidatus Curtissbacteria bacterium]